MKLNNARIMLTGASGGIGQELAKQLSAAGARLCLVAMNQVELDRLLPTLTCLDDQTHMTVAADLTDAEQRHASIEKMQTTFAGIDALVYSAGVNDFALFAEQDPLRVELMMQVNALAPMLLAREILPVMHKQGGGLLAFVGSTFGSIGFSGFTAYSASKFALRGFSQALRRELHGSGIDVCYIAPRAVRTPLNSEAVYAMGQETNMNFDSPEKVAREIVSAIRHSDKERYIGFPESLFTRVNGVLPGLVDKSLAKQNAVILEFASGER